MWDSIQMYLLLIVGFVLLIKGADIFVDGSASVAKLLGVPGVVIGLTVVAMGTSAPEAAVSISAGLSGDNEIAVSNVVGSNIFNLLVVVGACAAIRPFKMDRDIVKRDFPVNIAGCIILLLITALLGSISRIVAAAFLVIMAAYIFWLVRSALKNREKGEDVKALSPLLSIIYIVIGIAGVVFGGELVKDNACLIAESWGWSKNLIGLTIIAIGTSLPELVTSIIAARKGESGLALGNVVGSNIFNIFFILGLSGAISPIGTDTEAVINCALLLGATVAMFVWAIWKKRMGRIAGLACLTVYAAYTTYLLLTQTTPV